MYLNIIVTLAIILILTMLRASIPTKNQVDKMKLEQIEHNEYQKEINEKMTELHEQMLDELIFIGSELQLIKSRI